MLYERKYSQVSRTCKNIQFFYLFWFFFQPHLWHMEVPWPGIQSEPQFNLHHSCCSAGSLTCLPQWNSNYFINFKIIRNGVVLWPRIWHCHCSGLVSCCDMVWSLTQNFHMPRVWPKKKMGYTFLNSSNLWIWKCLFNFTDVSQIKFPWRVRYFYECPLTTG